MFAAYGAHPAEQFEVIQRWPAPTRRLCRPARPDGRRWTRRLAQPALHLRARRRTPWTSGPEPFVTLEWGGCFIVPSIPARCNLPALAELPLPVAAPSPQRAAAGRPAAWQLWLERTKTPATPPGPWVRAQSRRRGAPRRRARGRRGRLPGAAQQPRPLLRQRLRHRMVASVGPGYLGMDDDDSPPGASPAINAAIRQIREDQAYAETYALAAWFSRASRRARCSPPPPAPCKPSSTFWSASRSTCWRTLHPLVWPADSQHLWGTEYHPPSEGPAPLPGRPAARLTLRLPAPSPPSRVEQAGQRSRQAQDRGQWLATEKPAEGSLSRAIVDAAWARPGPRPIQWPPPSPASCSASRPRSAPTCSPCWAPGSPRTSSGDPATVAGAPAPRHYAHAVARLRPAMLLTLNARLRPSRSTASPALTTGSAPWTSKPATPSSRPWAPATQANPPSTTSPSAATGGPQGAPPHACPGMGWAWGDARRGGGAAEAGTLKPTGSPVSLYFGCLSMAALQPVIQKPHPCAASSV